MSSKKPAILTLVAHRSFDKTLGHSVCLDNVAIQYVDGPRRNALAFIARFKKATVVSRGATL